MRLPSIRDVAADLRAINANVEASDEDGVDVRLCIWPDTGRWCIRSGDVSYDLSHAPLCGSSIIPGVLKGEVQRFDARAVARDLISQCRAAAHEARHDR